MERRHLAVPAPAGTPVAEAVGALLGAHARVLSAHGTARQERALGERGERVGEVLRVRAESAIRKATVDPPA